MGLELFNVVKSISSAISAAKLTFFIDMLAMKPTKMISGEDIDLMQHLAVTSTKSTDLNV